MGTLPSKPADKLRYIDKEVNSLRSSIRSSRRGIPREKMDELIQNLAEHSGEVSSLTGKVKQKRLDATLKNISETMNEIFTVSPRESELDQGAVETNSFIQVPINKRQSTSHTSLTPAKKSKSSQDVNRASLPTLRDIEIKLSTLKPHINTSIENKDSKQLRVHQQTIKVLAGDLEMIEVQDETPVGNSKKKLQAQLSSSYQKVTKAMKEIKRNNDIQYLSKQSTKEKAFKDFEAISKSLEEAESLLESALRSSEKNMIRNIQDSIVRNNQRLKAIDIKDVEIEEKKAKLSQKITNIVKGIDEINKKQSFEDDLSQAKVSYNELVKNMTNVKNKGDLKNKLESLQEIVRNLDGFNEESKRRKEELLNNIEKSIHNVSQYTKTASQIVEDSVVLRNKPKTLSKDMTEIERFYSHWRNVRDYFNISSYNSEELSRIDDMLHEMQGSIYHIRQKIALMFHPMPNLVNQNSHSSPKLNSSQSSNSVFGSSKSIDQHDQAVIKTTAKYYNISTPELHNINDQIQEDSNHYNFDGSGFSKIEEIKTQVYYIKEKVNDCSNIQHLKNKLEFYIKTLEEYVTHNSQAIANNAKIVLADIQEILLQLSRRGKNTVQRISAEDSLENIVGIQDSAEKLINAAQAFTGKREDKNYEKIKQGLIDCKRSLENVKISPKYEMIQQQREELLKKIDSNLNTLDNRSASCNIYEDAVIQEKRNHLKKLKEKVNRFAGTYKGVLYNKIEMELNKLLLDVNENIENKEAIEELIKDAEKFLKILEQRSSKAQSFRQYRKEPTKPEEQINMAKIKNDLISIKREIDRTPENNVKAFIGLKSRLDLVNLELDQISVKSNESLEKEKHIFANEAQTLKNVVEAKIALGKQPLHQWTTVLKELKKVDPAKEIAKVKDDLKNVQNEVNNFVGQPTDINYLELDDIINKLCMKLDQFHFIRGTDLYVQKLTLLKEIRECGEVLDRKAKETRNIVESEKQLNEIEMTFDGCSLEEYRKLEEKLIILQSNIIGDASKYENSHLAEIKNKCLRRTTALLERINLSQESNRKNEEKSDKNVTEETNKKSLEFNKNSNDLLDDIEKKFNSIKPEIEAFTGKQSDDKFYDLDECNMRLILKLDKSEFPKGSDLHLRKIKLLKEMHKYEALLEDRAREAEDVAEIEQKLTAIDTMIQEFSGRKEDVKNIEEKLVALERKIETTKYNVNLEERQRFCQDKYNALFFKFSTIKKEQKKNISTVNKQGYHSQVFNFTNSNLNGYSSMEKKLNELKDELKEVQNKVSLFNDTENSREYQDIDEILTKSTFELNKLQLSKEMPLYQIKISMLKDIQEYTDTLDERAHENENLLVIENQIEQISDKMQEKTISNKDIDKLDEALIALQIKIGKLQVNEGLSERKNKCINEIAGLLKQLKDQQQKTSPDLSFGTLV